ncbi:hypothetical protein NKG05_03320 [Oerskovia sp. M15]
MVLFAMTALSNYGIITWMPAVLTDAGGSPALGGSMVALYSAWGMVAALVVPTWPRAWRTLRRGRRLLGRPDRRIPGPDPVPARRHAGLGVRAGHRGEHLPTLHDADQPPDQDPGVRLGSIRLRPRNRLRAGLLRPARTGPSPRGDRIVVDPLLVLAATAVPGVVAGWFACRPRFVEDSATQRPDLASAPSPRPETRT